MLLLHATVVHAFFDGSRDTLSHGGPALAAGRTRDGVWMEGFFTFRFFGNFSAVRTYKSF